MKSYTITFTATIEIGGTFLGNSEGDAIDQARLELRHHGMISDERITCLPTAGTPEAFDRERDAERA